jgi:hypothetical protein
LISLQTKDNTMKIIKLFLILFIGFISNLHSQNCYKVIADFSGIDNTSHLAELESAACALRDSMPIELRNKFKVYDFGFYVFSKDLKGGNDPIFKQAVDKAKAESEFYVLFGKESNSDGIYTKFWFDMKLPNTARFTCMDSRYRSDLISKYKLLANTIHNKNNKDYSRYHEVEIAIMDSIAKFIYGLKDCCTGFESGPSCDPCVFSLDDIRGNISTQEFDFTDFNADEIISNVEYQSFTNVIVKSKIKLKSLPDLSVDLNTLVTTYFSAEDKVKAYIFDDLNTCSSFVQSIDENNYENRIVVFIDKEKKKLSYKFYLPCNFHYNSYTLGNLLWFPSITYTGMTLDQANDYRYYKAIYESYKSRANFAATFDLKLYNFGVSKSAKQLAYYKVCVSDNFHVAMSGAGFVCDICDLIDGGLYLLEGDLNNAKWSALSVIPLVGSELKVVLKDANKTVKYLDETAEVVKMADQSVKVDGKLGRKITLKFVKAGKIYFGRSGQLVRTIGKESGKIAHHLIPWELFAKFDNPTIKKLVELGFHPNQAENGMNVLSRLGGQIDKFDNADGITEFVFHGNHPKYTTFVTSKLDDIWKKYENLDSTNKCTF